MAKDPATAVGGGALVARLVAELAVIVVGVLIALWADGWVSERAERRVEAARVTALRDNVAATRRRLRAARGECGYVVGSLRSVAHWASVDGLGDDDVQTLTEAFLFGPSFTREMNVYSDLENSGELALLTRAGLRESLAVMDAALDTVDVRQDDLLTVQQLNFDPFIVQHLALTRFGGEIFRIDDLPPDPPPALPELRILHNLSLFKLDLVRQVCEAYDEAEAALLAVETVIADTTAD